MPVYKLQGPDGRVYTVEGPQGATAEQLGAFITSQSAAKPQESAPNPSAGGGTLSIGPFDTGIKTSEGVDRALSGAGKAFADIGRGVGQAFGQVSREDVAESRKRDAPLMDTTAGKVGNFAGNVAMLAPTSLIPGANTVTGAATIGAVTGMLQPSVSTGETIGNTVLGGVGGAAGQAVANGVGAVAKRAGDALTQGQRASAKAGEAVGMRLTPGKASGSTVLQKIEAAAESNPLTASGFDAIREQNQKAINRAAAKAVGEKADELSTPVLEAAQNRLGAVFDSVSDRTPVLLDPNAVPNKLTQILQDSEGMLNNNASVADNALWKRLESFASGGGASREQLRALSSNLGKAAKNNMTGQGGDRELGQALFQAQNVVEDAIQGSLSPAQAATYGEARGQYRNLMNLIARNNVVNPSSGNVSGRTLANTLMQRDRGGFTMGGNTSDLYSAARFSQAFPDIVGNSGTATRSMGPADYLAGLPGNLLARLYLSRPVAAAAAAGAGAGGTTARLAQPVTNYLASPVGAVSGLGAAQWFQQ